MGIEWTDSAAKWEISQSDALYAMFHAVYESTQVKINSGNPKASRKVFIGPQHAQTKRLIEVLIEIVGPGAIVVYHVMPLGSYYRRQMEEDQ